MLNRNDDYVVVKDTLVRYKGSNLFVEIPEGVRIIGEEAFAYLEIEKVCMPDTVIEIKDKAFYNCESLYDIKLSSNLAEIGYSAFEGCRILPRIDLPEGLESLGSNSFSECYNLTSIELPNSLKYLGNGAFKSTKIREISIPKGISYIWSEVFRGCSELQEISLPEGLKEIGSFAFYGCKQLKGVAFPASITWIGAESFAWCDGLADENGLIIVNDIVAGYTGNSRVVKVPEEVKRIADEAFSKKNRIRKIILPNSIEDIGNLAFSECRNLREINIPKSTKNIHPSAFWNCHNLGDDSGFIIFNNVLFEYHGNGKAVVIPNGVSTIEKLAFPWPLAYDIEELTVPETVEKISEDAFGSCRYVRKITFPERLKDNKEIRRLKNLCECANNDRDESEKEKDYLDAIKSMETAGEMGWFHLNQAKKSLREVRGYKDTEKLIQECDEKLHKIFEIKKEESYQNALDKYKAFNGNNREVLEQAIDMFEMLSGYKDSEDILRQYYKEYWELDI